MKQYGGHDDRTGEHESGVGAKRVQAKDLLQIPQCESSDQCEADPAAPTARLDPFGSRRAPAAEELTPASAAK